MGDYSGKPPRTGGRGTAGRLMNGAVGNRFQPETVQIA